MTSRNALTSQSILEPRPFGLRPLRALCLLALSVALGPRLHAVFIDFEDLPGANQPLNGEYPAGLAAWGADVWRHSPPGGIPFATKEVAFTAGRTSGTITFLTPQNIVTVWGANVGSSDGGYSLACPGQATINTPTFIDAQTKFRVLPIDTYGWDGTCTSLTLSVTGSSFYFDDIRVEPDLAASMDLNSGGILTASSFSVRFNRAVDLTDFRNAVALRQVQNNLGQSMNTAVPGVWTTSVSSEVFTFTPSSAWPANARFALSVSTALRDTLSVRYRQGLSAELATLFDASQANVVTHAATGLRLDIPAGAVATEGAVTVSTTLPAAAAAATRKLIEATEDGTRAPIGSLVDVTLRDAAGAVRTERFQTPVQISFPYADADGNGVIDGSNPPVMAKTLGIHYLDETNNLWVRLPSSIDTAAKRVTAETPHFTVFAVIGQFDTDLSAVNVFPVPFRAGDGHRTITFSGLGQNTKIKIFTVTGELVKEFAAAPNDGQAVWDVANGEGTAVASGVYVYLLESGDNWRKGKIMIIR